jgi:hypothetical protein
MYRDLTKVGVKKDEELHVEEIEASHTLGGAGRCSGAVIHA